MVGGRKFYDRKEIKDILAYLRLIVNPSDDLSFGRIVNVPKRGIGDASVEKLREFANMHDLTLLQAAHDVAMSSVSGKAAKELKKFATIMDNLHKMQEFLPITELVQELLSQTTYLEALRNGEDAGVGSPDRKHQRIPVGNPGVR